MTEAEWLTCDDPERMLEFVRGRATDRKLRRFASAVCDLVPDLLDHRQNLRQREVAPLDVVERQPRGTNVADRRVNVVDAVLANGLGDSTRLGGASGAASKRRRHCSHHCEPSGLCAPQAGQITHVSSAHGSWL